VAKEVQPAEEVDLATLVRRVSEGMDRLLKSGLNRKAVVVLLHHHTGIGIRDLQAVLDGLTTLAKQYTR
jgi:hypothetical protein